MNTKTDLGQAAAHTDAYNRHHADSICRPKPASINGCQETAVPKAKPRKALTTQTPMLEGPTSRREVPMGNPAPGPEFRDLPLELIDRDPDQVRSQVDFSSKEFAGMCWNVATYGVLHPILVQPAETPGRYKLIAGELRFEASKKAGCNTILCRIEKEPLNQSEITMRQLMENIVRTALNPMDLGLAFDWLVKRDGGGLKARQVAKALGKSESYVSEHRSLLRLSTADQQQLKQGAMSFDEARAKLRKQSLRPHSRRTDPATRTRSSVSEAGGRNEGGSSPADNESETDVITIQERLANGSYVYQQYVGSCPHSALTVLVVGPTKASPHLDNVIRLLERHLHLLKLMQQRDRRTCRE